MKPDTAPATIPATKPPIVAIKGLMPLTIIIAVEAAPSGNEPSAERSAISKIRKVIKTPIAMIDHKRPCEIADKTISSQPFVLDESDVCVDVLDELVFVVLELADVLVSVVSEDDSVVSFSILLKSIPKV